MSLLLSLSGTAERLLARFGEPMTLTHQDGDPVYDPATGGVTASELVTVFNGYARSPTGQDLLDGSVLQTDLLILGRVSAVANDRVQVGIDQYQVKIVRRPAVVTGQDVIVEMVVSR